MVSIIDVQQILMQEPRASWKGAQLIAHAEFQSELIRQKQIEEQKRKLTVVQKTNGISAKTRIPKKRMNRDADSRGIIRQKLRRIDLKV